MYTLIDSHIQVENFTRTLKLKLLFSITNYWNNVSHWFSISSNTVIIPVAVYKIHENLSLHYFRLVQQTSFVYWC